MKKQILFIISILIFTFTLGKTKAYTFENDLIYYDKTSEKVLYLTFDDGYYVENTNKILDILSEKNIKASFFYTGDFMLGFEKTLKRTVDEGHLVGNHTFSHVNIENLPPKELELEIIQTEQAFYDVVHKPLPKYFRPPEGKISKNNIEVLKKLNYNIIMWNVNYPDYDRSNDPGEEYAYKYLTSKVEPGNIILMHTMMDSNVKVLPKYIDYCKNLGFRFELVNKIK